MSEEIYNEFDHLLDMIREEMKSLSEMTPEHDNYAHCIVTLQSLRDSLPEEKEYTIDLQSFNVSAYSKEHAKAKAVEMLKTGDETAAIDNVIEEEPEGPVAT